VVEQLRALVHRFLLALWTGPLFIGLNLRSGKNSERVAVSLLDQTRFNACVHECVGTLRTRYNPTSHLRPTSAVRCASRQKDADPGIWRGHTPDKHKQKLTFPPSMRWPRTPSLERRRSLSRTRDNVSVTGQTSFCERSTVGATPLREEAELKEKTACLDTDCSELCWSFV
jgi:hypothetical protein